MNPANSIQRSARRRGSCRVVRRRSMQGTGVVDGDAAGFHQALRQFPWLEIRLAHSADEDAIFVMAIVAWSLCEPGTISMHPLSSVISSMHTPTARDVVVGMRIEGPILMPFHRAAVVRLFHVQLGATAAVRPGPINCSTISKMPSCRKSADRRPHVVKIQILDAAQSRTLSAVIPFQIEDVVTRFSPFATARRIRQLRDCKAANSSSLSTFSTTM